MQRRPDDQLTVYQAKFQTYLLWSQPFLYRLLESLQSKTKQIVLTQRVENADLFPMPVIKRLNSRIFYSPYHAHVGACELQQRYQGDLIHAHFGFTAYKLILLKLFMRIPMVATFGGTDLAVHAARPKTGALYRVLFDVVEQLVAVSEDLRQSAIRLGCPPEKIVTVHRGVDTGAFRFEDRESRGEKALEILMVSRLSKKKGHLEAVAALARLPEDVPDWRLSIVGSGPEEAAIRTHLSEKGLAEKVRFKGNLPIEEVRQLMADSDILLHPSLTPEDGDREGIPNAVMEGQATGLPVVSTRHGGIPELVVDGETGLLVENTRPLPSATLFGNYWPRRRGGCSWVPPVASGSYVSSLSSSRRSDTSRCIASSAGDSPGTGALSRASGLPLRYRRCCGSRRARSSRTEPTRSRKCWSIASSSAAWSRSGPIRGGIRVTGGSRAIFPSGCARR